MTMKRGQNRGQVTIFIILGILILVIIAAFFFIRSSTTEDEITSEKPIIKTDSVQLFVKSCLESTAKESLNLIGQQGGYYELDSTTLFVELIPKDFYVNETTNELIEVQDQIFKTPYYYNLGEQNLPNEDFVKNEIQKYFDNNFLNCINDFRIFKDKGILFKTEEPEIEVSITNQKVIFKLIYQIEVTQGSSVQEFKEFEYQENIRLRNILDVVKILSRKQQEVGNYLILGDLTTLAQQYSFTYDLDYLDKENVLYILHFQETSYEDYIFAFAAKYDWQDELAINDPILGLEPLPFDEPEGEI